MQDELFDPAAFGVPGPKQKPKPKPKLEEIRTGKVDFRMALSTQGGPGGKVKSGFATAVALLEKAKTRYQYYVALSRHSAAIATEVIEPIETVYAGWIEKEVRLLDSWWDQCPHKLTRHRRELLRDILISRLDEAIGGLGLTGLEPLLERHQPAPEPGEEPMVDGETGRVLEQLFGVKFDPKDFQGDLGPEEKARLDAKYGAEMEAAAERLRASGPKKTKRQLAKEAEQAQAQELLDRDLNRVFKDLVVKLHPDLEQDEDRRREKEELMKLLTHARDENDYSELLRLHVLVNESQDRADRQLVTETTLKTLTRLLNQKADRMLQDAESVRRQDFLMARILDFSQDGPRDRERIRREALRHAVSLSGEIEHLKAQLALITRDSRAFYQYLKNAEESAPSPDEILRAMLGGR